MITAHLKKLRLRAAISADEERVIHGLVAESRRSRADTVLAKAGQPLNVSMLVLDGWLVRSKDLPSGERQVMEIHLPGDFADLYGFTLKQLDHDLIAITECVIGYVPHERLMELTEKHPRLARIYWLSTNIDAAITREMALSLGDAVLRRLDLGSGGEPSVEDVGVVASVMAHEFGWDLARIAAERTALAAFYSERRLV